MINVNDLSKISSLLSSLFFYGFSSGYSSKTIEEKILKSEFINKLEKGDASYLYRGNLESIVGDIFKVSMPNDETIKTNPLSLWLGEIYTRLFFTFNKSFSFIFLYLPLSEATKIYPLYHEMDFSQLIDYFAKLSKQETLMTLLLKKYKMSARELSILTGVNYNTIVSYTRDNDVIYNAKFDSIFKISEILGVNINIFAKSINNFTSSGMFDFDKTNQKYRSYLGLFFASYFSSEIANRKYEYNEKENIFVFNEKVIKVLWTSISSSRGNLNKENHEIENLVRDYSKTIPLEKRKDHILIIFEYNQISLDPKPYLYLVGKYGFEKIFIINDENVLYIDDKCWSRDILETINNMAINNAKRTIGGDFAV